MTNEEVKVFLDNLKICINEHPVVADWLVEIADRKTEPQTDCATCRHSDTWEAECRACDNYSNYEPRKENPQADMREREEE